MKITMLFFTDFQITCLIISSERTYKDPYSTRVNLFRKIIKKSKNSFFTFIYIYRDSNEFEYVSIHEFVKKIIFVYSQLKSTITRNIVNSKFLLKIHRILSH